MIWFLVLSFLFWACSTLLASNLPACQLPGKSWCFRHWHVVEACLPFHVTFINMAEVQVIHARVIKKKRCCLLSLRWVRFSLCHDGSYIKCRIYSHTHQSVWIALLCISPFLLKLQLLPYYVEADCNIGGCNGAVHHLRVATQVGVPVARMCAKGHVTWPRSR